MITVSTLMAAGVGSVAAGFFADPLAAACQRFGIDTPRRAGALVGQCMVESTKFTVLCEDLFYTTPELILANFSNVKTIEQARTLTKNPRALANVAYANRLGNGDVASGDGWAFAGKGLIQLTGRDNVERYAREVDPSILADTQRLAKPVDAALSAAWFFKTSGLIPLADAGSIDQITRIVNGKKMLHADLRRTYTAQAVKAFS